jgi:hypothetical protein
MEVLEFHGPGEGRIKEVRVRPGSLLSFGKLILIYQVLIGAMFRIRKYFCNRGFVNLNCGSDAYHVTCTFLWMFIFVSLNFLR